MKKRFIFEIKLYGNEMCVSVCPLLTSTGFCSKSRTPVLYVSSSTCAAHECVSPLGAEDCFSPLTGNLLRAQKIEPRVKTAATHQLHVCNSCVSNNTNNLLRL